MLLPDLDAIGVVLEVGSYVLTVFSVAANVTVTAVREIAIGLPAAKFQSSMLFQMTSSKLPLDFWKRRDFPVVGSPLRA